MKKVLTLFFFLFFFFQTYSQEQLIYSEVINCDVGINELYSRGMIWFGETYYNSGDIIHTRIKEDSIGAIIGKASFVFSSNEYLKIYKTSGYIDYSIRILVKNGRYKYEIKDFKHIPDVGSSLGLLTTDESYPGVIKSGHTKSWYNKVWKELKRQTAIDAAILKNSIKDGMKKKAISAEDNW